MFQHQHKPKCPSAPKWLAQLSETGGANQCENAKLPNIQLSYIYQMILNIFMRLHQTRDHESWVKSDSFWISMSLFLTAGGPSSFRRSRPKVGIAPPSSPGTAQPELSTRTEYIRIDSEYTWRHLTSSPFWKNCQWVQISNGHSPKKRSTCSVRKTPHFSTTHSLEKSPTLTHPGRRGEMPQAQILEATGDRGRGSQN